MSYLDLFKKKKIIVTGHTGFKGSWLVSWLNILDAKILGISNGIPTDPSNYEISNINSLVKNCNVDIRDTKKVRKIVNDFKPDFIFHLAAQALVGKSYKNQIETLATNSIGSASLLESLLNYKDNLVLIMITSDKVYDNKEWIWGYRETDQLGGSDPYSISKSMAELAIRSYLLSSFNLKKSKVRIGIGRAGNVIGGGDWAENRVVPDCIKAWSLKKTVSIRNPLATRPWQHVLEPLSGYLKLAANLYKSKKFHGEAYNFGPNHDNNFTVKELIKKMSLQWPGSKWNYKSMKNVSFKESGLLKLNCEKSLNDLNWMPTLDFEQTIKMTIDWYRYYNETNGLNMQNFNNDQILKYMNILNQR